jgi:hypothetical protein
VNTPYIVTVDITLYGDSTCDEDFVIKALDNAVSSNPWHGSKLVFHWIDGHLMSVPLELPERQLHAFERYIEALCNTIITDKISIIINSSRTNTLVWTKIGTEMDFTTQSILRESEEF